MIFNISFFIFSVLLSYTDCSKYRIPNITIFTLFIFLVCFGFLENKINYYSFILALAILLFFVIILILIPKTILGGGDIKYMMIIAIYLEPLLFPLFLVCTGLIQMLFLIYYQKLKGRRVAPMAPAMFLATIITLLINKNGLYM